MEYLIGFLVGSALIVFFYRFVIKNNLLVSNSINIPYSQSHIFNILKPFSGIVYGPSSPIKTQATEYEKSQTVRVVMTDGQAYWIRDHVFYTADINEDYSINNDSTKIVDTMAMDRVQLEKIITIVDTLTKGSEDDDSRPGDTWL